MAVLSFFQDDFWTLQTSAAEIPQIDGNYTDFSEGNESDSPDEERKSHLKRQIKAVKTFDSGTHYGHKTQQVNKLLKICSYSK